MSQSPDIFSIAFHDYLAGNTRENLKVKVDIGGNEKLPVAYFFREFEQMPFWEQMVLNQCKGRVLDVGAGAGSHALYLQGKGFNVTAIDISIGAVNCMKQRGIKDARLQDFFSLDDEKFDTILFLMNGTGMARSLHGLTYLLTKAASLLAPGGSVYLESTDILYMYEDEDGSVMINLAGNYYGEINYQVSYKKLSGEPFPWLFVDFDNLSHVAHEVGLDSELFFQGDTHNYVARLFSVKS